MQGYGMSPSQLQGFGQQPQPYGAMPPQANGFATQSPQQQQEQMRAHFEALRAQQQRSGAQQALGIGAPSAPTAPPPSQPAAQQQQQQQRQAIDPVAFEARLRGFFASRGTPLQGPLPQLDGHDIDLSRLFQVVFSLGGPAVVTSRDMWGSILQALGVPATQPPRVPGGPPTWPDGMAQQLAQLYGEWLAPFEMWIRQQQARNQQASLAGPSGVSGTDAALAQARQRAMEAGRSAIAQAQGSPHNMATQRLRPSPEEASAQLPPHLRQPSGEFSGPRMTNGMSQVHASPMHQPAMLPSAPQSMPPPPASAPPPSPPKKRKRLRIDYQPIVRPVEDCVVFPVTYAEEWDNSVRTRRKPRHVTDLGPSSRA